MARRAADAVDGDLAWVMGVRSTWRSITWRPQKVDEVKAALRNVEAGREGGVQTDRRARAVDNPRGTGDCVVLGKDGVQQDDLEVGPAVAQGDFERLAGAVQAGQPFEYGLLVKDTMGSVDEFGISRAVGKGNGHAVRAVVARAEDGIFLRQQVKRVGTVCALDVRGRGEVHIPRRRSSRRSFRRRACLRSEGAAGSRPCRPSSDTRRAPFQA